MGCVASKLEEEEEEETVSICRERKRRLKIAVERRYALAEAHCKYFQALLAVSAAIKLFVARHSSPASPFLVNLPPPSPMVENVITNPLFLQQRPPESSNEAIACESCSSSTDSESSEEENVETMVGVEQIPSGYFYMQMPLPILSPSTDFGWDFFNPFDYVRAEDTSGYRRSSDDDLNAVREEEGIPKLEEEVERGEPELKSFIEEKDSRDTEDGVDMVKEVEEQEQDRRKHKALTVLDRPVEGRQLLEALKDIEDHFYKAYESGKDVSRMLEANRIQMLSRFEEIKENSTKLIQAITWPRSALSKPSTCKSLVASGSRGGSSTRTVFENELFDNYRGMDSGSHSSTLRKLYAWERKLYEEVKAVNSLGKIYDRKCSRLQNLDVRGDDELMQDKIREAIKDLYARILVAIRSAQTISENIEKLRDKELLPQIIELLKGLTRTWKIMLESHETQNKILVEVRTFSPSTFGKGCNASHQLATIQLHAEIQNWRECFTQYVTAQKAYVESLKGWLNKFLVPEVEYYSRAKSSTAPSYIKNGPPLLMICCNWLASMETLPDRSVYLSLKSFGNDVRSLFDQQLGEQQQRRRIDSLAKELEKKIRAFEKTENRFCDLMTAEQQSESETDLHDNCLTEKKDRLDKFRRKLEMEKERHHKSMQETRRMTLIGFQTGFSAVFESLSEFSKASHKAFNDLVIYSENMENIGT